MRNKLLLLGLLAIAAILALLSVQACRGKAAQCPLCARDIHSRMQVSIKHNHLPLKTCCMACALTYRAQSENVTI